MCSLMVYIVNTDRSVGTYKSYVHMEEKFIRTDGYHFILYQLGKKFSQDYLCDFFL